MTPSLVAGRFPTVMAAQQLPEISPPIEDYLKVIYTLIRERGEERASTSAIADRMEVSAASATNMMQKLADMRLVEYVPYRGVSLTEAGEKMETWASSGSMTPMIFCRASKWTHEPQLSK